MKTNEPSYDVFISYRHAVEKDRQAVLSFADQLQQGGVRVFVDENSIRPFDSITRTIQRDLFRCKAMVVYLTQDYLASRACVWELTAAYIASQKLGAPSDRIFVVNPEDTTDQLKKMPVELQDAKYAPIVATAFAEIPRRLNQINGTFQDIGPLTPPAHIGRPLTGSNRFAGRLTEMWEIHSNLNLSQFTLVTADSKGTDIAQVSGMGGIGKTLLAEEYALRFGAAYPGGIYWLEAHGSFNRHNPDVEVFKSACKDQYLRILNAHGQNPPPDTPFEFIRAAVASIIKQAKGRCLWIVDDVPYGLADHLDAVKAWFAPHPSASTLVTTRSREYNAVGKELPLDVLDEAAAFDLLINHGIDLTRQKDAAVELVQRLGGHAMALDIAGATIANYGDTVKAYLKELDEDMDDLIDASADLIGALPSGHERSIVATYKHSLLKLGDNSKDYLRLAANLSPAVIPNALAEKVFALCDGLEKNLARKFTRQAIAGCNHHSLVKSVGNYQQVHALTSAVVDHLGWAMDERAADIRAAAIDSLTETIQSDITHDEAVKIGPELEHARHLTAASLGEGELKLIDKVAEFDRSRGHFQQAIEGYKRLIAYYQDKNGPDHTDTLTSINNLAETLWAMGDHKDAKHLLEQVLERRKEILGPDHPDTMTSINNLSETLWDIRDFKGAKQLQEQVFERRKEILGPDHPDTMTSINTLSLTLREMGNIKGAKQLQEQVLERRKEILGLDHPDTMISIGNLAGTLWVMGEYKDAKQLFEQQLELRKEILGPDHPKTLLSMGNIASTLGAMGDHKGAKQLQEQQLERCKEILGPDHPKTLFSMGNIASTLGAMGDHKGAKQLQEQQLERCKEILGPDHPETMLSMGNLASTLGAMGDHKGAKQLQEQQLERCKEILGPDHPETMTSLNKLTNTLRAMGDHQGAKLLCEQVLERNNEIFGPEHPNTMTSMDNLARFYWTMGDYNGAKQILEQVIERRKEILGTNHPDTMTSINNLAETFYAMGDHKRAKQFFEQQLERRKKILGPDHPDTLTSLNKLTNTLRAMGDHQGAKLLYEQVLERRKEILGPNHPDTLISMGNLAVTLRSMGNYNGAKQLFEQQLERRKEILDPDHPDTLIIMNNLAATLGAMGDHQGAKLLYEQVLERRKEILGPDHPSTTISAWNLFETLSELNETIAAQQIMSENLLWMLNDKVVLHDANQLKIRDMLIQNLKRW